MPLLTAQTLLSFLFSWSGLIAFLSINFTMRNLISNIAINFYQINGQRYF
ncbi:hypothetical protein HMPREF1502_0430 [Klebsiella sp. AS10]|nr:hypothetical protein HMPREF1502_0430 [Klebsiella sp. AS10]